MAKKAKKAKTGKKSLGWEVKQYFRDVMMNTKASPERRDAAASELLPYVCVKKEKVAKAENAKKERKKYSYPPGGKKAAQRAEAEEASKGPKWGELLS